MKLPKYAKSDEHTARGLKTFNQSRKLFSEIKKRLKRQKTIKLLEIGCGKGILLLQLRERFPNKLELHGLNLNKYHGIKNREDFKKNAEEKKIILAKKDELPNIHFGNAANLMFKDSSFDIIISQVTFIHIKDKAKALEEVYLALKKGGIALISLGPYSVYRGRGHKMSYFYKELDKKLKKDYNPRFLIKKDNNFIRFSQFIGKLKKEYGIKLWKHKFVSKTQRATGYWLIIKKEKNNLLKLNLKYNKKLSKKLTKKYSKKNPVNFGCVDIYNLKSKC